MRTLPRLVLFGAVLSLNGCSNWARPTDAARKHSAVRGAKDVTEQHPGIAKASFLLFSSDSPISVHYKIRGSSAGWRFEDKAGVSLGLATGIARDGYILTAAHVTKKHIGILGWMGGRLSFASARVVHSGSLSKKRDFAILHIDKTIDSFLPLTPLGQKQRNLYSFAVDRKENGSGMLLLSGVVTGKETHYTPEGHYAYTDTPLWHGDSGGGVLSAEGHLVGVNAGWDMPWMSFHTYDTIYIPDAQFVQNVVSNDRTSRSRICRPANAAKLHR